MLGREDFNWKKDKLYLGKKDIKYSVVLYEAESKLYKIKFPDGGLSEDYYNLSRAKDNCIRVASKEFNDTENGPREPH